MTLLKRTFTSIYAKIDQMVGEIENHDALIEAAIKEQKKKIATAKIQLRRVQASEKSIAEQQAQLSINAKLWTQRAANEASGDSGNEQQALLCLQRRQKVQQQQHKLLQMKEEYQRSTQRMQRDISQCEDDLAGMMQKHQVLRARQSTAEAMQLIDAEGSQSLDTIESSFDRWEVKISQGDYAIDRYEDSVDNLEMEYLQEENEQQLRYELAELLRMEKTQSDGDPSSSSHSSSEYSSNQHSSNENSNRAGGEA